MEPLLRHSRRDIRRRATRLVGVPLLMLLFVTFQDAVAVGEVATTFVPPPRTIHDITAILQQPTQGETQARARARGLVDQPPPDTTDAMVLSKFYELRGRAAFQLGRAGQYRDDLTQALDHATRAGQAGDRVRILNELWQVESLIGSPARVITYIKEALAIVPPDQRGWLILLNGSLARRYSIFGNIGAAETVLREAERVRTERRWGHVRAEDIANWDAQIAIARAYIFAAQGRLAEAEERWREALRILATAPGPRFVDRTIVATRDLSGALAGQGRPLEAEVEARRALLLSLQTYGRANQYSMTCATALAQVLFDQGRSADAEVLTREILAIQAASGMEPDAFSSLRPRQVLFSALSTQGRWQEAVIEIDRANEIQKKNQLPESGFGPWPALALINTGRVQDVTTRIQEALSQATNLYGASHPKTAKLRGVLAMAHARQGDLDLALADFAASVPILLERAGGAEEEGTGWIAADRSRAAILDAHIAALIESQRLGPRGSAADPLGEAFRIAEANRGRAVAAALTASSARSTSQSPALSALIRQEQDAGKQIGAFTAALANQLSLPTSDQNPAVIKTLRGQIASLTQNRQAFNERIRAQFPAYAQLINPKPAAVVDVQTALRPGEALVSFYVGADRTLVWAVPKQGPRAFAMVPAGTKALEAVVTDLRRALDPSARTLGEIPPFDLVKAHDLYDQLLTPVQSGWRSATSLFIVAHGPLGQLPFALLTTAPGRLGPDTTPLFANYRAVPWLVRTHAVTVLPSAASLVTLRALSAADATRRPFLGFGDPYFNAEQAQRAATDEIASDQQLAGPGEAAPTATGAMVTLAARSRPMARRALNLSQADSVNLGLLPRLPDTADEIRGIAAVLHADMTRDVFLGVRATEKAVKTIDLDHYRVIAFATHGLVPGDLDGLTQPALALTAPEVAGGDGDGLLKMEDVLTLKMNADWVVLSACNTASGQGAGAEAVSGLGRAFFYAGARSLLVSNWPVETSSARTLTIELFRRQAAAPSLSGTRALQQTLNTLIDTGGYVDAGTNQIVFSYAHPIFWAAFSLIGDGG